MADELVFYTNPQSRGRMIRWMLEEVGQPYRTEIVDYDRMKGADYLAINPMGKVPALTHGGVVVTEVAAICSYLADAFPEAGLAPPPADKARGAYYRWLFFAAGPIEAAISNRAMGWEAPPERQRMMGYGNFDTTIDTVEAALKQTDYLAGGRFSAADVYLGSHLAFSMQFGMLPPRPVFETYLQRLVSRPAAMRAREIDDSLIAEQQKG
jgi:glutathione S-transferase